MIDVMLLAIVVLVTFFVAEGGAFEAGLTCLSVIFAGLLAMNYFEPLASVLDAHVFSSREMQLRSDVISLLSLFAIFVTLFRLATEFLSPSYIALRMPLQEIVRWSCAVLTGYVTMAVLLTALHTAPLRREFLGFRPERSNFFGLVAPDRQWLGFTQYVSENSLRRSGENRVFDGPALNLQNHANRIWPSFPIRYATRREQIESGQLEQALAPSNSSAKE